MANDEELDLEDEDGDSLLDAQFEVDKSTGKKIRKAHKIEIIISDKNFNGEPNMFTCDYRLGKPYISVDFNASYYGAGNPCETDEEVLSAIEHCKEWITREGDIPIVKDKRIVERDLTTWFG